MGEILILGGSRYFGKRLVNQLLMKGDHQVTVATRGLTKAEFIGPVDHLIMDRNDESTLVEAARSGSWDVVFDNICYSPDEALAATKAFDGYVGKYILTSTLSVYDFGKYPLVESDFDPFVYDLKRGGRNNFSYDEGKRQAEAAFFQKANFPISAMRIPIVLGLDDYTRRLHFHVERVMQGMPIGITNLNAEMSYITSEEAADFLQWLGSSSITGPINASSHGKIAIGELIGMIESIVDKKAIILPSSRQEDASPFGVPTSWVMDTSKAQAAGYNFTTLSDWLPHLISLILEGKVWGETV